MLRELLLNTQKEQRASVRAEEVFKVFNREISKPTPLVFTGKRIFRIVDIKRSYEKVEIFARVFEGRKQIGFGDGSVDIERFVFVNPPTLVDDPNGDIFIPDYDREGNPKPDIRLREDPLQALHEALQHTVEVMKSKHDDSRIQRGKIGNTTTTVYSSTGDGIVRHTNGTWSTLRSAATGTSVQNLTTGYCTWALEGATYNGYQPFHMFDTSAISSSDTISSATYSVYLNGDNLTDGQQLSIGNSTQATWNSIGTADFDQRGGATEGCTRINHPDGATSGFLDFTMNATGRGFIARSGETIPASASASGKTQIAIRWSRDLDNSTPTANSYIQIRTADYAGTSSDPKLVVEHSSAVSVTFNATALAGTFSIPTYSASTSVSLASTVLSASFTIPAYTVTAIQNVSISSSVLASTFSIPAYTVVTSISITPTVLSATFSIPTYSVDTPDAFVSVSALTATFSVPVYTIDTTRFVIVSPDPVTATFTVPSYTIQTQDFVTISASVLTATFTIPTYTPTGTSGISFSVGVLSATFSIPTYTPSGTQSISVSASVLTGTFSIPSYAVSLVQTVSSSALSATFSIPAVTVTAIRNVSLSPSVLILSFVIPAYFARGDFWQEKYAVPNTTWSENFSVPTTNWSDKGYNGSNNWSNKY